MATDFKLVEIKEVSESLDCKLCSRPVQDPDLPENIDLGPLYEYGVCRAHHFCLMFSSGLEQKGEEDQGIMGFQPDDIIKEWKRGSFLKCFYCKKKYSTVGCIATGCRECGICLDNLNPKSYQNLYSPCCGGYFHRNCMRRMAYTAGAHFFKCPLCNNRDEFTEEMLQFGIYIPEQDAKWETDDGGFEDLLVRPDSCDAEVCLCPEGRKIDREDTVWETIICVVCGSKGIHIECGGLNFDRPRWKCDICRDLLKNVPSRPVSVFSRVKLDSSSNDKQQILARVTERTKFKLKSRGKGKKKWDNLEERSPAD